ncbi:L-histidine N(alpha)-methyltransferase [Halobacillus litoralis]|uniref:L-histidine N(alpha)-methyltransferase n=1 Tax=Halobacillus litoralis TaxID=45668 RepID=UPI00136B0CAE|nr:L-histidine N(alpha)-methyltransferase [Halobacillus litoralis]MYL39534.1 L-histidine N(alpha)-methyltransferase [Halobacillus litoralis]
MKAHLNGTVSSDMLTGLFAEKKWISSKFLYDEQGSQLFEQITDLPEYYQTRTEAQILLENLSAWKSVFRKPAALIELGSGSSKKTKILLDHVPNIESYIPIDISEEFLADTVTQLQASYPGIHIQGLSTDYTQPFTLPDFKGKKKIVFFPGSTIGNFEPREAELFLENIRSLLNPGDQLIFGVDRKKDEAVLKAAYDDAAGVTAAFNKNLLTRINREHEAAIDVDSFSHVALYNPTAGRIEMHLESSREQVLTLGGHTIEVKKQERIHTENSYKYDPEDIIRLGRASGFLLRRVVSDEREYFSVCLMEVV